MPQSELYKAEPDVVACELDGGAALLDLRTSLYFSLNPVGAALWEALKTPASVSALSEVVAEKFDVAVVVCQPDVEAYLKDLHARKLITISQG